MEPRTHHSTAAFVLRPGLELIETYRLEAKLASGGMAEVWRGRHLRLRGRQVAIKILLRDPARRHAYARFCREAEIAARVRHAHVAGIVDFGVLPAPDWRPYMVLDLVEGETLRARLRRGPIVWDTALALVRQLAGALDEIHARGILHHDIKPENVMVSRRGTHATLLDFGVSDLIGAPHLEHDEVLGTPGYIAPERWQGGPVGPAADVYALAALFVEMVSGAQPGCTNPAAIHPAAARALEVMPASRFQTAGELVEALGGKSVLARGSAPRVLATPPVAAAEVPSSTMLATVRIHGPNPASTQPRGWGVGLVLLAVAVACIALLAALELLR